VRRPSGDDDEKQAITLLTSCLEKSQMELECKNSEVVLLRESTVEAQLNSMAMIEVLYLSLSLSLLFVCFII